MTIFLTVDDVLEIHCRVVEAIGGTGGLRDVGLVDSAVHRPQASFGGQSLYPTLCAQAAALLHSLTTNHPFLDGNKRTAYTATDVFLRLNGATLRAIEDEAYDFMIQVAAGALPFAGIVAWLEQRVVLSESSSTS